MPGEEEAAWEDEDSYKNLIENKSTVTIEKSISTPTQPMDEKARKAAEDTVAIEWNPSDVILDTYEVQEVLGEGGMGKVFKVHHRSWNADLAVKCPRPDKFKTKREKSNFVTEAETWVNLDPHPNIVSCYYVRTLGGMPRLFAEYVDGGSLKEWIKYGKLKDIKTKLDVAIQFTWGLEIAHKKGLIHQDIKPANVMMTKDGIPKVTDFGIARVRTITSASENTAQNHNILEVEWAGYTPGYESPEQSEAAIQAKAGVPFCRGM